MKLAACYIWQSPFMYTEAAASLLRLTHPPGHDTAFFRGKGWGPARRHIDACEQALAWGADLLVILGADQTYPPDLLCRLVQRFEDGYDVVAAMVPMRGHVGWQGTRPFQPVAWRWKRHDSPQAVRQYRGQQQDGDMLELVERCPDEPMQRIDFIGSGVLLFHRDHLLSLKRPWFFEQIDHETQQRTACMDTRFVYRLQMEAGARIWCDTSIPVRHLHIFPIDDTFQDRFADWAQPGQGDPTICRYRESGDETTLEEKAPDDGRRHDGEKEKAHGWQEKDAEVAHAQEAP